MKARWPGRGAPDPGSGTWIILHWLALLVVPPAHADAHLQRFRFDAETSFAILALPGVPTDLQLDPEEHVTGFALGDTLQWMVEELPGHVFLKPLKPDLFTAGTLVTDRRTYQLTLRSGRSHDEWMQRVSWSYPDLIVLRPAPTALPHGAERVPAPSATVTPAGPAAPAAPPLPGAGMPAAVPRPAAPGVDPVRLVFEYRASGVPGLQPVTVFDDGHATWMKMRPAETLPVLFVEGAEGEELVHYAVRGDWLVAPRLADAWVLRAGRLEARVQRLAPGGARESAPTSGFWR